MNILRTKESLAILNGVPVTCNQQISKFTIKHSRKVSQVCPPHYWFIILPALPFTHFCVDFNTVSIFGVLIHSFFSFQSVFFHSYLYVRLVIYVLFTKKLCPWASFLIFQANILQNFNVFLRDNFFPRTTNFL